MFVKSSNTPLLRAFGKKVKKRRKALGLTQEEVSKKVGVELTYICKIELAQRGVPLELFRAVAEALKCPMKSLLPTEEEIANETSQDTN